MALGIRWGFDLAARAQAAAGGLPESRAYGTGAFAGCLAVWLEADR